MSGLYGYFDPHGDLPPQAIDDMAWGIGCAADRTHRRFEASQIAIGCASKGIYPGEGLLLSATDGARVGFNLGRLLSDETEVTPFARAAEVFLNADVVKCCTTSNGSFAAAIWDERAECLSLITDRYGMYPLYVLRFRRALLFSTQLPALTFIRSIALKINPTAIALMLSIGEMVGATTPFSEISVLPAGSVLRITAAGESRTKYWSYAFEEGDVDGSGVNTELAQCIRRAVSRVCHDGVVTGVPLSGGLDSRLLLAVAPDPSKVPSFTWGAAGCRDLRYAPYVAATVGSPHRAYEFEEDYLARWAPLGVWITGGQLPCTDMHVLPFVDEVSKHCNTILNGYAGDVVLGGNFIKKAWWMARHRDDAIDPLWCWRDRRIAEVYRRSLIGPALPGGPMSDARAAFACAFRDAPGDSPMAAANAFLFDNRVRRFTSCGTALMRWGLESEHPFFDNNLFDAAMKLPTSWRYRHRGYRQLLGARFPEACRARWQRTGLRPNAPAPLFYASLAIQKAASLSPLRPLFRGRAVAPFAAWFRGPLRSYVCNVLRSEHAKSRGLVNPDTTERVLQDHFGQRCDNSALIGTMLTVELFARLFIDRERELIDRCRIEPPAVESLSLKPQTT